MYRHFIHARLDLAAGLRPPPPGVMPNFNQPESIGYKILITTTTCVPLSLFVLLLRLYTRRFIVRAMGAEDCKEPKHLNA